MLSAVEKKSDQVYRWLLAYIDENKFSGNQRLPSENALCRKLGVSRETIRVAIDRLVKEGLVYKLKGSGTYRSDLSESAMGIIARLDNVVNGLKTRLETTLGSIERMEQDEAELRSESEKPFPFETELTELRRELKRVNGELGML